MTGRIKLEALGEVRDDRKFNSKHELRNILKVYKSIMVNYETYTITIGEFAGVREDKVLQKIADIGCVHCYRRSLGNGRVVGNSDVRMPDKINKWF